MLTINEFPKSLEPSVRTAILKGQEAYQPSADSFVQQVDSTLKTEDYVMYGQHKGPRKFDGETRYGKIKEYDYLLTNETYFDALEIDYDLIKYEQHGKIRQKSRNFGYEWDRGIDKMAIETLGFGASNNCYDDTPFFGSSHVDLDSGVQSNINTGGSTFDENTYQSIAETIGEFKDDRGEIAGYQANAVIVKRDSSNALEAKKLANSTFSPTANNNTANPFAGSFEVVEVDYMPSAVQFIVADLEKMEKPIIRQVAGPVEFTSQERDSHVFQNHRVYRYAQFQDWAHGYNNWRLAYMQL